MTPLHNDVTIRHPTPPVLDSENPRIEPLICTVPIKEWHNVAQGHKIDQLADSIFPARPHSSLGYRPPAPLTVVPADLAPAIGALAPDQPSIGSNLVVAHTFDGRRLRDLENTKRLWLAQIGAFRTTVKKFWQAIAQRAPSGLVPRAKARISEDCRGFVPTIHNFA